MSILNSSPNSIIITSNLFLLSIYFTLLMTDHHNFVFSHLPSFVPVQAVSADSGLFELIASQDTASSSTSTPTNYSFCMCNPPFFASNLEAWGMMSTRNEDRPEPMSCNSASDAECITEGGEVDFVAGIIRDSLELRERVR